MVGLVANSFAANDFNQKIISTSDNVLGGLYIGGDYRLQKNSVKGGVIWTALRGKWSFSDEDFTAIVTKIITQEREFWGDHHFNNFLVSMIPIGSRYNAGGSALVDAFQMFSGDSATLDNHMLHMIAHENFHLWNGLQLSFDISEDNEVYYKWFTEGFTDYYAKLINLRSGLVSFKDYIDDYNQRIIEYYSSPANRMTIAELAKNYWQNNNTILLPYQQGEILAHNWNAQIKQATNHASLDNMMKALLAMSKKTASKLTLETVNHAAKNYLKMNVINDVNDLYAGHPIVPQSDSLGPCVSRVDKTVKLKSGKSISVPQFILDEKKWSAESDVCLAWFAN